MPPPGKGWDGTNLRTCLFRRHDCFFQCSFLCHTTDRRARETRGGRRRLKKGVGEAVTELEEDALGVVVVVLEPRGSSGSGFKYGDT